LDEDQETLWPLDVDVRLGSRLLLSPHLPLQEGPSQDPHLGIERKWNWIGKL